MSSTKPKKAAAVADFAKTMADARATVAKAKTDVFMARLDAIDTILEDAEPYDVLMVCAHVLAHAMPLCRWSSAAAGGACHGRSLSRDAR
jgi:hypothetical protein